MLILKSKVDDLASDIAINNKIRIYYRNKWNTAPQPVPLIYYGYIVSIDPIIRRGEEQTGITCMGAVSKLQNDFLRTGTDLAYEVTPNHIDDHVKAIIEHYRTSVEDLGAGSFARSMLDDTTHYWADTDYIEDTSGIGTIPYRFFNAKHLDAVREMAKFLPKNDILGADTSAFWYWYLKDFDDGTYNKARFVLKKLNVDYDHRLFLNKHLVSFSARKNIEGLKNKVFFWNEKGDFAGEMVRTVYDDSDSQTLYDIVADRVGDAQVSTFLQARLLAEGQMKESKDVQTEATAVVSDANYDILSFNLGDVVEIRDLKNTSLLRKLILAGTSTSDGLVTTLIDSSRTEDDDDWNDYYIKFIGGDNDNKTRKITDFDQSDHKIFFDALEHATFSGDKYEIYAKNCRLIITKILLTPREAVLELSTPRPDLTTQVESDRAYVDKQLKWFGHILTRIDGTRVSTGVQHWITDDVAFSPKVASPNDTIEWTGGTFYLPNDVRRVISSGYSTAMATDGTKYYFFIDEATCYYNDAASVDDTGKAKEGETFLYDSGAGWTTDEWKGYIVYMDFGGGNTEKHVIARNTSTILYVEAHDPIDATGVPTPEILPVDYEIHKFALRQTNDRHTGSLLKTGSATDAPWTKISLDDSTLTQGDDFWNGYEIKFLSGSNIGLTRVITDFQDADNRLIFSPELPNVVAVDDTYQLYISSDTRIIIMAGEGNANADQSVKMDSKLATTTPDYQIEGALRAYDAIHASRYVITDLINARMDTASKRILSDFDFGAVDYAGAVKAGTISWDASGENVTGSGVALYRKGLVGAAAGTVTFSIDVTTGKAIFRDEVIAAAITGGTITGAAIRTAAVGNWRAELRQSGEASYPNELIFYSAANTTLGEIKGTVAGNLLLYGSSDVQIGTLVATGLLVSSDVTVYGGLYRGGGVAINIGTSGTRFGNLYLSGNIAVGGTVDGIDIASHAGNPSAHHTKTADLSEISINVNKNWNAKYISNLNYISGTYLKVDYDNAYIYGPAATLILDFYSTKLACKKPFGFEVRAGPPGAAAAFTGYMYYDTNQTDLVFSNGTDWYKVTASAI